MAQSMALTRGRAFTATAKAPRLSTRRVCVRAVSKEQQVPLMDRLAPSMLAALMTLSTGFATVDAVYAPAARADEEEMSPYEKRQAELERRRELLREAREKAAARAAGTAVEEAAPAPAPAPTPVAPSLSNSLQTYKAATENRPSVPTPAPEPAKTSSAPKWGGFSFSKPAAEPEKPAEPAAPAKVESGSDMGNVFSSDMWNTPIKPKAAAPAPAPTPAPVTPAPTPFKAPEPVKKPEAPKPAAAAKPTAATKPGKKRGPLPLWFAEVLVLGAYAGLFLAVTKYSKQSGEVLAAVWAKVVEAYKAAEKLVNSKKAAA